MNRAVTIVFRIGGTPYVLTGPEVPIEKQSADFKGYIQHGIPGAESVELWTSNAGSVKRKKLPVAKQGPGADADEKSAPDKKKIIPKGK